MASTVTRQLAVFTSAVLLTAPLSIEVATAQARQQCSAAMPSNPQGRWWSYRLLDGRKCWYEGKPGLSRSLLEWPKEVSAQPASGEVIATTAPEKPRTLLDSQAWAPNSQVWTPTDPTDPDTFETRWRGRAAIETRAAPEEATSTPEEATSTPEAGPLTPEVDDVPSLRKADRLQLPGIDSRRAKSIRTLVINPDSQRPAVQ
jgi:hypothetical protein